MESDQYCRELEAHLCRRNGGHLVRIVGPAFDLVLGWHRMGIPIKVACQGLDRHIDRAAAKSTGRRRPVRIDYCEADVLDAFDEWRRAVGLRATDAGEEGATEAGDGPAEVHRSRLSLPSHLERTIARLTALRAGPPDSPAWSDALESAARQLDALLAPSRKARGEARDAIVAALSRIDDELLDAARRVASAEIAALAASDAEADLEPFRSRLSATDFAVALERGRTRALRTRLGLPTIAVD